MATSTLKTRIQHKNGLPAEWEQATNFVPLKGELIIYNDTTAPKIKIGDGSTLVGNLPFVGASITMNGAVASSPSFYAPTSAGTAGQVLKSNGSGAPSWITLGSNAFNSTSYLPLVGGKLKGSSDVPLEISSATENGAYIRFTNNSGTVLGWIGYTGQDNPVISGGSNDINYTILHAGNYSSYIQALTYPKQLTTDEAIDNFNYANSFRVTTWNNTSSPGVSNGIILNVGWVGASYGAQIAIDDDPTYYIALRQRDANGWKAWKRIPMADGTGASGTWGINITGSSASCTGNAASATSVAWSGITGKPSTFTPSSHTHDYIASLGATAPQTGRTNAYNGAYTYKTTAGDSSVGAPNTHTAVIGFGYGAQGSAEIAVQWTSGMGVWVRALRDYQDNWYDWCEILTQKSWNNYITLSSLGAAPASHTHSYLPLSGGTLTGSVTLSQSDYSSSELKIAINSAYNFGLHMGSGGVNHGLYDWTASKWIIYADASAARTQFQLYGAVWNDYAEYRSQNETIEPGYITYCDDDGKLKKTVKRLQKYEGVVSDTFGFAIGETDDCKTPLAVSGRALVYCDPEEEHFHSGDCVCAGPDGLAYRMTREEIIEFPDRIVGVVSEIPTYETWGTGNVEVNGRIWIKVK